MAVARNAQAVHQLQTLPPACIENLAVKLYSAASHRSSHCNLQPRENLEILYFGRTQTLLLDSSQDPHLRLTA